MVNIGFRQYSTAYKYIKTIKSQVSEKEWHNIKGEIASFAKLLETNPSYILWLNRNKSRWEALYKNCSFPQTVKLLKVLQKYNTLKMLSTLNAFLEKEEDFIRIEHAEAAPNDSKAFIQTAQSTWGIKTTPTLKYKHNPALIGGVRLMYQHQTLDMSYRAKRHNLILSLRRNINL